MTPEQTLAVALAHEFECKCGGRFAVNPGPCAGCQANALREEVLRLRASILAEREACARTADEPEPDVAESRDMPGAWHVEAVGADGEVYVAVFSGQGAERRAREYAAWKQVSTSPARQSPHGPECPG